MRKALVLLLSFFACLSLATDWIIGGGMVFLNLTGWNLSTGLIDSTYSVELGLDFDIGRTIEGTATNLYNLELIGKVPLYRINNVTFGPSVALMYGNFPSSASTDTSWKLNFSAGIFGEFELGNLLLSFGFLYPFGSDFDFMKAIYTSAKFFVNPPNRNFTDKLFLGLDLLNGRIRLMIGLIEPF